MPAKKTSDTKIKTTQNAKQFIEALSMLKSDKELNKVEKYFKGNDGVTKAFGVKFGDIFAVEKLDKSQRDFYMGKK